MVKRAPSQQMDSAPAKRHRGSGPEVLQKRNGRLTAILEPLLHSATLTERGPLSGQPTSGPSGREALLSQVSLPECACCALHLSLPRDMRADDIRKRVSPWVWSDVKQLLHRRCVHSLTAQHSKDGERVLLRGFLHVPHDDLEVCSCNGTPNAARVVRTAGDARPAAKNPGGVDSEAGGDATAATSGSASGCDAAAAAAGLAAPGTCGPPDRFTHVVEVIVSTEDWSLQSCSSSCCGVGYDALHSQLCPAVAAVLLAVRVARGGEVLCEHDLRSLSSAAAAAAGSARRMATEAPQQQQQQQPSPTMEAVTHGSASQAGSVSGAAADSATGEAGGVCFWTPHDLGFGATPVARVLAAVSGGALVLGPNYVDPPPPLAASILPGAGQPLGLQRELDCPRRIPEALRPHLLPGGRVTAPTAAAAAAGAGPSTSTTRPKPVQEPPPVPPPHVPALPAAEPSSRANPRYTGGVSCGTFPSAAAKVVFGSWYREAAAVMVTTDRYRESYRMLLPPEEEQAMLDPLPAERHSRKAAAREAVMPPHSWSFGAASGLVSLELTGVESAEKFISSRAADRGPVWEARMTFLTSHAAVEMDPETRLQSSASESPELWPPAVLAAFDEACSPVGQPPGANGPAGALCALLRITWLCLHVWEMDAGLARRAKLVVQAICKLLVVSDLPAYLRAASARILGAWRLKLGDASAHGRRTGYGSANDIAISDMLSRLTTAYLLARDGWDATHVLAAMGLDTGPAVAAPPPSASGRLGAREMGGPPHSQSGFAHPGDAAAPSAAALGQSSATAAAASAKAASRPDLQPTWIGFRPANQVAVRRLQQQPQLQQPGQVGGGNTIVVGGGVAAAAAVAASVLAPGVDKNCSSNLTGTSMPFVPYAPPPLQGVATMSTPAMQEVAERLHWLEHYGLDGPYVSLAAVSGEWSKAIKMLLRRGSKSDVERACRLAVERLSSAAAKAQQACFLLHQVLGPPQPQRPGSSADDAVGAIDATAAAAACGGRVSGGGSADADRTADTAGGSGVDSLVVSAVAQLPPTFVAGCAVRMFMSAVRAALSIKTGNDFGGNGGNSSGASFNANFELSFLRGSAVSAQNDAASPAAALLAAIKAPAVGVAATTRASPYTALLRSVIAVVAENQEREWRAEEASLRDLGLLVEPANPHAGLENSNGGGGGAAARGGSGASGSKAGKEGSDASSGGGDLEEVLARLQRTSGGSTSMEYVNSLPTVMRHSAMRAAAIPFREDHCDCDACRRDRRERLALMASEMPPGTVQYVKLRPEDLCFVVDPTAQAAFSKVIPLIPTRGSAGGVLRVHSLAVQVVRSVFRPMMALFSDPRERPRTVSDYVALLGTVEESMGTLCDEVMPERVQLQAVLEGATVALCALHSCHHVVGASPSALGRVVTDLLSAGQLELARQVAACQLNLSRSADSLAHTLEVAVASGEEAQLEASFEVLRLAAREPPLEQRLTEAMAAAMGRTMAGGMGGPEIHLGAPLIPPARYADDSDEYDSDDYSEYFTDDEDDDDLGELDPYGAFLLRGFPYRDMLHADREVRRYEEMRQRRREDRWMQREDRQALRAMLVEAQNEVVVAAARTGNGGQHADRNIQDGKEDEAGGGAEAANAAGGPGDESDVDTEDLLAGVRRCSHGDGGGKGGLGEEVDGPTAMEVDGKDVIHAGKERRDSVQASPDGTTFGKHAVTRHGDGSSGADGNGNNGDGGVDGSPRMSPRWRRRRRSQSPPHHPGADAATAGNGRPAQGSGGGGGGSGSGGGRDGNGSGGDVGGGGALQKGPHELALLLVQCTSQSLSRRLMKIEGDQNLFALAQYIRGRGAGAQLVAPLMAAAVVCLDNLKTYHSNSSMQGFTNEMVNASTAPVRHCTSPGPSSSRLEGRGAEGPCLKGLPASSWQTFLSTRSYR
ncbi:hypothetical protein Vafri_8581 [Volvox africanus]|uniref:Uncharacterized protein n=1 Tax=Volvox africanus TaxID=51714 RepID=A0A8J4F0G0_9CHLO|nr:hypothetical protein Vafri_8581 [Volvox africanus]